MIGYSKVRVGSRARPAKGNFNRVFAVFSGSVALRIFLVLLLSSALMGGGSRADILSLLILRPVSAVIFVFALLFFGRAAFAANPKAIMFLLTIVTITALQLVPLPPDIWTALPGRATIADSFALAGTSLPWLPVSVAPADTWNALFAMLGPFGAFILALILKPDEQVLALRVVIVLLIFSGLIGFLQIIGSKDSPLFLYRLTSVEGSVGLFANRNHHAMALACALPMLAVHVTLLRRSPASVRFQENVALTIGCLILPLILTAGSRFGVLALLVGLISAVWIYRNPQTIGLIPHGQSASRKKALLFAVLLVGVAGATLLASRALSVDRLFVNDSLAGLRFQVLPPIINGIWDYFPVGSGFGTFVAVYQALEPDALLSEKYLNHAHNEPAEILLTGGVFGLLIMLIVAVTLFRVAKSSIVRYSTVKYDFDLIVAQRGSLGVVAIFVFGSAVDYPLRVPLIAVITALVAAMALRPPALNDYRVLQPNL